jgi:sugar/nucleoside kinase (ribokinase family)
MIDVVGVGANSVDYVYRLPEYPRPDSRASKLQIRSHAISCGGQVATALAACAAMGLKTAYVGALGRDDNGRRMREELTARGVDATHAVTREAVNPYAVILLDEQHGERIVLWDRSPALALRPDEIPKDLITASRLLHVDDVDEEASMRAAGYAREAGIPVTSDIERVTERTPELVAAVSIPIFGEHVLEPLTGERDFERALRALRRTHDGLLCVTLGAHGAMLLEGDHLHHVLGIRVPVTDTTGAGDVFRGAFIAALLRGDAPEAVLRFANAAAALSCTRTGAISSVPTLSDVYRNA